jgi:hypothetical protein
MEPIGIPAQVLQNFLTFGEIEKIIRWFSLVPPLPHSLGQMKHLHYHRPGLIRSMFKSKFDDLLGKDHVLAWGSYKEDSLPHPHHIDNHAYFDHLGQRSYQKKHNITLVVPLSESRHFKTIFWNRFAETRFPYAGQIPESWQTRDHITLDENLLTHIPDPMRHDLLSVPIDRIVDWQLGDAYLSHRSQLHASNDFAKYSLVKKFLVFGFD